MENCVKCLKCSIKTFDALDWPFWCIIVLSFSTVPLPTWWSTKSTFIREYLYIGRLLWRRIALRASLQIAHSIHLTHTVVEKIALLAGHTSPTFASLTDGSTLKLNISMMGSMNFVKDLRQQKDPLLNSQLLQQTNNHNNLLLAQQLKVVAQFWKEAISRCIPLKDIFASHMLCCGSCIILQEVDIFLIWIHLCANDGYFDSAKETCKCKEWDLEKSWDRFSAENWEAFSAETADFVHNQKLRNTPLCSVKAEIPLGFKAENWENWEACIAETANFDHNEKLRNSPLRCVKAEIPLKFKAEDWAETDSQLKTENHA